MKYFIISILLLVSAISKGNNTMSLCSCSGNQLIISPAACLPDTPRIKFTFEIKNLDQIMTLAILDTAPTLNDMTKLFGKAYGEIMSFIRREKITAGQMAMAWYHTITEPFIVEAAIEIKTVPSQTSGRISLKKISPSEYVVVHFLGPYSEMEPAYQALDKWLSDHNKTRNGMSFEVYLNDPATVTDPYQLQTDIYQPIR